MVFREKDKHVHKGNKERKDNEGIPTESTETNVQNVARETI